MKEDADCVRETVEAYYPVDTSKFDLDTSNCRTTSGKDLNSDQENGQARSGNKNAILRSSYFQKSINENKENEIGTQKIGNDKFEDVISKYAYKPLCALSEGKDNKRAIVRSFYFQHKHTEEDLNCEGEMAASKYPVKTSKFDSDAVDNKTTGDGKEDRVKISYSENNKKSESQYLMIS